MALHYPLSDDIVLATAIDWGLRIEVNLLSNLALLFKMLMKVYLSNSLETLKLILKLSVIRQMKTQNKEEHWKRKKFKLGYFRNKNPM